MTIICRYCNTQFEWESNGRAGRPPTLCEDHRENRFHKRIAGPATTGYFDYEPPQEVPLSYEEGYKCGLSYEQRRWLKELIARVQRPKQHRAWKILGRD